MNVEDVLDRFDRVRRSGRGWVARCPAHEDRSPSLSIAQGSDGGVVLHCFAGCPTADVLRAASLSWRNVSPERQPVPRPELLRRRAERERRQGAAQRIADEASHLFGQICDKLRAVEEHQRAVGERLRRESDPARRERLWTVLTELAPTATRLLAFYRFLCNAGAEDIARFVLHPAERTSLVFGE